MSTVLSNNNKKKKGKPKREKTKTQKMPQTATKLYSTSMGLYI
jgi:hypothetical protein